MMLFFIGAGKGNVSIPADTMLGDDRLKAILRPVIRRNKFRKHDVESRAARIKITSSKWYFRDMNTLFYPVQC